MGNIKKFLFARIVYQRRHKNLGPLLFGVSMRIWLCDLTYDSDIVAADTMPTNIGYVCSYLLANSKYDHDVKLFKYPGKLIESIDKGPLPDVIGFSHYIWNARISYKFVEILKKRKADIVCVFGGVNYPRETKTQKQWFADHNLVDFHVLKEGEAGFCNLIDALCEDKGNVTQTKSRDIPGVHYIRNDGSFYASLPVPRLADLSSYPSPYLSGLLDEFFDGKLMPLLTTNRGCPFSCTYCTEGDFYFSKISRMPFDRIALEIDYIAQKVMSNTAKYYRTDVYVSDSNFGTYKEDLEIAKAFKQSREQHGWPSFVLATTGKNQKERVLTVANLLDGAIKLSGSVQSLAPEVQENIKRKNIKTGDLMQMALDSCKLGANSYSEIILGLPGDSLAAHKYSLEQVINAGFDYICPWQLVILADTELAEEEVIQKFGMKTKYRAVARSHGIYYMSDGTNIPCAEIERVCVEGNNLSFRDYLEARSFHLAVNIFYNDNWFANLLKIVKLFDIKPFSWMEDIFFFCASSSKKNQGLGKLFNEFIEATKDELWDSEEELARYIDDEAVIDKFIDGTLGANLLGKYRILSMIQYHEEIHDVAKQATKSILNKHGIPEGETENIIDELIELESECKKDIFSVDLADSYLVSNYDILKFLQDEVCDDLPSYKLGTPKKIKVYRTSETADLIKRNSELFGKSINAKHKQLTRIAIKKLHRKTSYVSG